MDIKIIQRYFDKIDKRFYEQGALRKVPDERGKFLIKRGFAVKTKQTEKE